MATGIVGVSGLAVKIVAPNSPKLMVKAKIPPATSAFEIRGRSMHLNICKGDAPSIEAASPKFSGMDRRAGRIALTTKGNPTRAWVIGIKKIEVLKFKGGLSRVMMMPNPNVTAEVDKGSMKIGSKNELNLLWIILSLNRMNKAAQTPVTSAIIRAVPAKIKEYLMARTGGI